MRITRLLVFALLLDSSPCLATGSYQFADHLMKSITSDEGQVSEKTVLEPTLYSYFSRLLRKSCQEVTELEVSRVRIRRPSSGIRCAS